MRRVGVIAYLTGLLFIVTMFTACEINNTNTNTNQQSQSSSASISGPSGDVSAGGGSGQISRVAIEQFGGQVAGQPNSVAVGADGSWTCTPKSRDASGGERNATEVEHGQAPDFFAIVNGFQYATAFQLENKFNLQLHGVAVGTACLSCSVKGVTGSSCVSVVTP